MDTDGFFFFFCFVGGGGVRVCVCVCMIFIEKHQKLSCRRVTGTIRSRCISLAFVGARGCCFESPSPTTGFEHPQMGLPK